MNISKKIDRATKILKEGGVIAYPTDTAYGLGADLFNSKAVDKIYKIKGRDFNKPLTLIAANLNQVKKIAAVSPEEQKIISEYWPGPLTILLKAKNKEAKKIGKDGLIGVRVPDSETARSLADKLGKPIIATSANMAGKPECYSIYCVVNQFMNKIYFPDLILDGGNLRARKITTIIKVVNNQPKIIRQGKVKINV